MKPTTSCPPATPTDYTGRGVRNRPTVDLASPVPMPGPQSPQSEYDRGDGAESGRRAVAGRDQVASPWRRLQAAMREHPVPVFAAAVVCGWILGAGTRRRRTRTRAEA